jgi:uncharacterized membrane protein YeaQ/YmgE (transglycosylase-associated protein family)
MDITAIIIWVVVGIIAGWIAGKIVRGTGFGMIGDFVIGIIGAVIGGWLLPRIGVVSIVGQAFVDMILFAAIGAVILLIVLRLLKR